MDSISRYMYYINKYPDRFINNPLLNMVLEEEELRRTSNQMNKSIGVVFENEYITLVVDLIKNAEGNCYTYSRILNKNEYNGVVVIPIMGDRIVFIKQFRHATRNYELELPRGFSEGHLSKEENARTEIYEELGVKAYDIKCLGTVVSDSGLVGGVVYVFCCKIDHIGNLEEEEGIENVSILTWDEIDEYIRENKIRDSFSISALYKYRCEQ